MEYTDQQFENISKKLYDTLREEIDIGTNIKDFIVKAITDKLSTLIYFQNFKPLPNDIVMHYAQFEKDDTFKLPVSYTKKVFESQDYGNKILLELLKERFPEPINISIISGNTFYKIVFDWDLEKTRACTIL